MRGTSTDGRRCSKYSQSHEWGRFTRAISTGEDLYRWVWLFVSFVASVVCSHESAFISLASYIPNSTHPTSHTPTSLEQHNTELRIRRGIMNHIPPKQIGARAGAFNLEAIHQVAIITHQAQHVVAILHEFAYKWGGTRDPSCRTGPALVLTGPSSGRHHR